MVGTALVEFFTRRLSYWSTSWWWELKKWSTTPSTKPRPFWGRGVGSVGRAVTSDTRDLRFKSCHRQNFIYQFYNRITEKTKIKKKRPFKKTPRPFWSCGPLTGHWASRPLETINSFHISSSIQSAKNWSTDKTRLSVGSWRIFGVLSTNCWVDELPSKSFYNFGYSCDSIFSLEKKLLLPLIAFLLLTVYRSW